MLSTDKAVNDLDAFPAEGMHFAHSYSKYNEFLSPSYFVTCKMFEKQESAAAHAHVSIF